MDTSMDSNMMGNEAGGNETDETLQNAEFPVSIDTLSLDGTNPKVGDDVEVKVGGKVTRVVNDLAYVKPATVNGEPLPQPPIAPNPAVDERSRLMDLSGKADASGQGVGDY